MWPPPSLLVWFIAHPRKYLLNGISHVVSQFIVSDLEKFAISLGRERVKVHKPLINIFITLFEIQWHSWRALVWITLNALVQTIIECSLHSIYKNWFSIEQYNFKNYFVLSMFDLNNLSIQTSWQIVLHEAVPLRTFSYGHSLTGCTLGGTPSLPA